MPDKQPQTQRCSSCMCSRHPGIGDNPLTECQRLCLPTTPKHKPGISHTWSGPPTIDRTLPSQSASLCLTTTPAEQLARGLKLWLSPLGLLGVPVAEISLTLLLSLRFLAVVFEEVRNLALGLAARNVQWKAMGKGAGLQVGTLSLPASSSSLSVSPQ